MNKNVFVVGARSTMFFRCRNNLPYVNTKSAPSQRGMTSVSSQTGGGDKKTDANKECPHDDKYKKGLKKYAVPLAGAVVAIAVAPMVVSAVGFGTGGVVAGTAAAKMASLAATVGYGNTVVAGLQSVGAAGYSVLGNAAIGMVGAVAAIGTRNLGRKVSNKFKRKQTKDMKNEKKNDP